MTNRPLPPPTFDPASKQKIRERFKDVKAEGPVARDPRCVCQWHSPEPGIEVRINTSNQCPVHNPPPGAPE